MKKMLLITGLFVVTACSSSLIKPTADGASKLASEYPGVTLTELNEGRSIFKANCGKCHPMPDPTQKTADYWKKIVPPMASKAGLSEADGTKALKYALATCMK